MTLLCEYLKCLTSVYLSTMNQYNINISKYKIHCFYARLLLLLLSVQLLLLIIFCTCSLLITNYWKLNCTQDSCMNACIPSYSICLACLHRLDGYCQISFRVFCWRSYQRTSYWANWISSMLLIQPRALSHLQK